MGTKISVSEDQWNAMLALCEANDTELYDALNNVAYLADGDGGSGSIIIQGDKS